MKRVRTLTVLALGWLGSAAPAEDLGWKKADEAPAPAAPMAVQGPALLPPKADEPEAMPWKTAQPSAAPVPIRPPAPPLAPVTIAVPVSGLEPLPPAPTPLAPDREPPPIGPTGPRASAQPQLPREFPAVTLPEAPKPPATEPLPAPRPLPSSPGLYPQPVCNDSPEFPMRSATLNQAMAVTPASAGIPVRQRTFGSPPVRISRDYFFRDMFGLDLLTNEPNTGPAIPVEGPPDDTLFVQAEYLLWWTNRPNIPVLATTNSTGAPGFLGQPGTQNLLGPGTFGPGLRDGFRIRAGAWLDDCGLRGIDGSFFFLGRRSESFSTDTARNPVITRPFFAPNINAEFGEVVSQPGLSSGRLDITADSFLWGADVNYRRAICRTCDRTTGWFVGYRHLNLTESLTITERLTSTGPLSPDPVGTQVFVQDRFETRNRFHGAQAGGFWNRKYGRFDWDLRASVALGVTQQTVRIDGAQQRTRPGEATENFNGGLLATGPNLDSFTRSKFSVVPEITTNIGYSVTPNLRVYVGYNFLYWNNVVRPGDTIDRTLDLALIPNGPAGVTPLANPRPQPVFRQSDFWAQGVQFGVELRW